MPKTQKQRWNEGSTLLSMLSEEDDPQMLALLHEAYKRSDQLAGDFSQGNWREPEATPVERGNG